MDCELFTVLTNSRCVDCRDRPSPIVPEVIAFGSVRSSINDSDDSDYDSDVTRLVSPVNTPVRETRYSTPRRTPSPEVMPQPSRRRRRPASPPNEEEDRKSTRLNPVTLESRMPSSA